METRENEQVETASGEARFESNLSWILKALYRPVEARGEFREDLFDRMKSRQALLAAAHRRKSRVRYIAFSSSAALAASVVLIIALGQIPAGNPGFPESAAGQGVAVAEVNSGGPEVQTVSNDSGSVAVAPIAAWQGRVEGLVEARTDASPWSDVSTVALTSKPLELRASSDQAGLELVPGVRVVMEKGSSIRLADGKLRLQNGLLSLRLLENAAPLEVQVDSHVLRVQPDSWVGMELKDDPSYAEGGRPAPDVTLMSGKAELVRADSRGEEPANVLLAGHTYRLFRYPNMSNLRGTELDERELDRNHGWINPTLVNFQVKNR